MTWKGLKPEAEEVVLQDYAVAVPPLAEQHRIVAKVNDLMAHCDRLEAGLDTLGSSRNRLLESLLHDMLASAVHEPKAVRIREA